MAKFNDMPVRMQAAVVLGVVLGLSIAAYFFFYKAIDDSNKAEQQKLTAKLAENENLRQYEPKLQDIRRQIAMLKDQIEIQKRIVPDEKEADQFIHVMRSLASKFAVTPPSLPRRKSFSPKPPSKWKLMARISRC